MQYKTMILELIQSRERLHSQLKVRQVMLPAVEHYATGLRERHLLWVEELQKSRPELDQVQLRQVAMELALAEYVTRWLIRMTTYQQTWQRQLQKTLQGPQQTNEHAR